MREIRQKTEGLVYWNVLEIDLNQESVKMTVTTTAVIINGYIYVCPVNARHCVNRFIYCLITMPRTNL